jgi:phosphoglucomutase/phosphomannomutase
MSPTGASVRQPKPPSCAITYDTRHQSRHFAELCAEVMVANGFRVYFLDGYRSTPELSFAVRHCDCDCGIMVTASHNPPSDNAVKAYWSTGGQLLPPHDTGVINCVMQVTNIKRRPFRDAVASGEVVFCQSEVDREYVAALVANALAGPRDLNIVYSPLHGVGASNVVAVLAADGFTGITLYPPHAEPDGDFPNVPGHVANPENPVIFDSIIEFSRSADADVAFASDPDSDRLGCAAPLSLKSKNRWGTLTGNQIGALLTDFVCERRKAAGTLTSKSYVVKTLVTTELIRRIADSYGVRTEGNLQVGFKYIGGLIDDIGPDDFLLGAEESYGFLVGQYARDKDAAAGALLLAELAAQCKARGQSLHEKLDALYWQFGCHEERQISVSMPGSAGMQRMQQLMERLRSAPPTELAGMKVVRVRDYQNLTEWSPERGQQHFVGPIGNMVMIDLNASGARVAVRPSGTEPKVKYYLFAHEPAEQLHDLEATKVELRQRLDRLAVDLRQLTDAAPE